MLIRLKRILIKVSGEALMGQRNYGHDHEIMASICQDISSILKSGIQVCLVVGGGNIYRGMSGAAAGMDRATADYMGMLATIMNALALQNLLEKTGVTTRVLSAIPMTSICEPYIRRRGIRHMEKGRVVIFAAGTGNPFFTTDTAATLRAVEMGCDMIFKGTQVDGVYTSDPKLNPDATKLNRLSYKEVIARDLKIMDTAAITLAKDNKIPILVFNINSKGALPKIVQEGKGEYTIIEEIME